MLRCSPRFAQISLGVALAFILACKGKKAPTTVAAAPPPERPAAVAAADDGRRTSGTAELTPEGPADSAPSVGPIRFPFDSTSLDDTARGQLTRVAGWLEQNSAKVTIEGHADDRGTTEYNVALGQRRAEVIAEYLARLGIARARLRTVSYGEERPAVEGEDEAAWAQNRRGELRPDH